MPEAKRRVLHVFGALARGGAEIRTLEVLRKLDRSYLEFAVVALSSQRGDLESVATADGVGIYRCPLGPGFGRRFKALLSQTSTTVLHSHVHYTSGYLLWLASGAGVRRRIAHFRTPFDGQPNTLRRALQRSISKWLVNMYATDILAVSEGTMASAWRADWKRDPRCKVIFNGLDTTPFEPSVDAAVVLREFGWTQQNLVYINVASFQPAKNQVRAVEVFSLVAAKNPRARLLLVGRDVSGYQSRVRELVRELELDSQVVFAGERSDVPRLLKSSDVLLFPSLREGLPGVLLESCAAGLPAVASDIPGVLEIARYFDTVYPLSLAEDNTVWASQTEMSATRPRQQRAASAFADTPFSLDAAALALSALYDQ